MNDSTSTVYIDRNRVFGADHVSMSILHHLKDLTHKVIIIYKCTHHYRRSRVYRRRLRFFLACSSVQSTEWTQPCWVFFAASSQTRWDDNRSGWDSYASDWKVSKTKRLKQLREMLWTYIRSVTNKPNSGSKCRRILIYDRLFSSAVDSICDRSFPLIEVWNSWNRNDMPLQRDFLLTSKRALIRGKVHYWTYNIRRLVIRFLNACVDSVVMLLLFKVNISISLRGRNVLSWMQDISLWSRYLKSK